MRISCTWIVRRFLQEAKTNIARLEDCSNNSSRLSSPTRLSHQLRTLRKLELSSAPLCMLLDVLLLDLLLLVVLLNDVAFDSRTRCEVLVAPEVQ